jgi:hypothetical protein
MPRLKDFLTWWGPAAALLVGLALLAVLTGPGR